MSRSEIKQAVSLANKINKMTSKRTTLGTPGVLKQVGFKTVSSMDTKQYAKTERVDLKTQN